MHSSVGQERHQVKCGQLKLTDFKIHPSRSLGRRRAVQAASSIPSIPRTVLQYPRLLAQPNARRGLIRRRAIITVAAGKADRPVLPIPSILVDKGAERFVSGNFDHKLAAEAIAVVNDDSLLRARHHGVGLL
jgi:hypothetical protein